MSILQIIGIAYATLIGVTIVSILIEHISIWRIRKLLNPLGVEKIEIGAHAALWKKIVLAPFIAWLFPMFIKSMYQTTSYFFHLKSLPEERRRGDYESEMVRRTLASMAEMMINKRSVKKENESPLGDDDLPF